MNNTYLTVAELIEFLKDQPEDAIIALISPYNGMVSLVEDVYLPEYYPTNKVENFNAVKHLFKEDIQELLVILVN